MSHNLKTQKIVAPRDGDLLLSTDYGKPRAAEYDGRHTG